MNRMRGWRGVTRNGMLPEMATTLPTMLPVLTNAAAEPASFASREVVTLVLAVVFVLGIAIAIFFMTRSRFSKREQNRLSPREQIEAIKARSGRTGDPHVMTSEMLELAQRLSAQLDNKATRLEELIAEADTIIQSLDGLLPSNGVQARPPSIAAPSDDTLSEAPSGAVDQRIHDDDEGVTATSDVIAGLDPLSARVIDLASEGRSSIEIARDLNETVGKVELILSLHRTRRSTATDR